MQNMMRGRVNSRSLVSTLFLILLACAAIALFVFAFWPAQHTARAQTKTGYLGFDLNVYPGDEALPVLRKTFAFSSYWIGPPPGEKQSNWIGKRAVMEVQGFGFVVLFNGRESHALKSIADAQKKGALDGDTAAKSAEREGFAKGTVIFLDIEEGGRLPASYHEYFKSWTDEITSAGYRAGVYCSAIPVNEGNGVSIATARDIQDHAGSRQIVFWVYNDACPPSPGCSFPLNAPLPSQSGVASAAVWQYAQSPRREFARECPASYAADGNCYAPGDASHKWFLDANVATSANPSAPK